MTARFLIMVLSCSATFWLVLYAAAFALDPTGLLRVDDTGAVTLSRKSICASPEIWKPLAFARSGARTVFLGTSRVAWGLNGSYGEFPGTFGKSFNFGLIGVSIQDVAALATQIMNQQSAELLILGIDYGMFHSDHQGLSVTIPERDKARDRLSFFTHTALSREVLRQTLHVGCGAYEFDPGTGTIWPRISNAEAYNKRLHLEFDGWLIRYASCFGTNCRKTGYQKSLDALRGLVSLAAQSQTKLMVFINPLPALHLELIHQTDAAGRFEQWKRDVAMIVTADDGGFVAPVRDFAVFAAETSDNLPLPPGSTDRVPGFMDFDHYSRGLGQIVQNNLVSSSSDNFFGAALRVETIESHLKMDRAARALWEAMHPHEISRLQKRMKLLHPRQ